MGNRHGTHLDMLGIASKSAARPVLRGNQSARPPARNPAIWRAGAESRDAPRLPAKAKR